MEWLSNIAFLVFGLISGWLLKHYFPTYLEKKAENLATKEDIQEITRLTEETQQAFRKEFERFNADLHFKYDFYSKQFTELYSYLYSIIIQSEYLRTYLSSFKGLSISFDDNPFLQVSPIHETTTITEIKKGEKSKVTYQTADTETPLSKFSFDEVIAFIIQHGELAEQELLKYSISYRFINTLPEYSNRDDLGAEGNRLQIAIIKSIVQTYNRLRKELNMPYEKDELDTGSLTA